MSSPTPDLKRDVHHYWTPSYAIVEMKITRNILRFFRCARIDEDVLVVENILLLNRHGGPRSNPVDKQHEVQDLLGVELDVGVGNMDAMVPLSPVEVCTRLTRELGSDVATTHPPPESDGDVVSMFSKAHLRACHTHMHVMMMILSLTPVDVQREVVKSTRGVFSIEPKDVLSTARHGDLDEVRALLQAWSNVC